MGVKEQKRNAHLLGEYGGERIYRFPVTVRLNNSRDLGYRELGLEVVARSAAEAANSVRDEYRFRAETEIFTYGPLGGKTYRYVGWESAIGAALWEGKGSCQQLELGKPSCKAASLWAAGRTSE